LPAVGQVGPDRLEQVPRVRFELVHPFVGWQVKAVANTD
jgi:hypothetical protein